MNAATLINQTSGNTEYYTPDYLTDAARKVMHGIELDPASCKKANETIRAEKVFTSPNANVIGTLKGKDGLSLPLIKFEDMGGLSKKWIANSMWMNHPFHRGESPCVQGCKKKACPKRGYHIASDIPSNNDWIGYAVDAYLKHDVKQACILTYAVTSEKWFRPLMKHPQCFLNPRTNYYGPDGEVVQGVTKGSVITYLGMDVNRFAACYRKFGEIKVAL